MRQISAKLNMYVRSVSIVNNNIEKLTLNFILGSFGALTLFYILFLGNMVMNIVERRSIEVNARSLSSEVRNLELTYLSLSNNVDLSLSYSLGFKDTKANFATRKTLGLRVTGKSSGVPQITQNEI